MPDILVVDDSPVDQRLFTELLQKQPGYRVRACGDGLVALENLAAQSFDLVLTDMQMPNMDGLELVRQIRASYPHVPVVLVTGHGSESLATKALRQGAAGYVPKSQAAEHLTDTIAHVLELSANRRADQDLAQCTMLMHYEFRLPNEEALIPGLLQQARQSLSQLSLCDATGSLQVDVALEHAVLNAMQHGNLEYSRIFAEHPDESSRRLAIAAHRQSAPYKDRCVYVSMSFTPDEARFVIRDEGAGFDVKEVSSIGLSHSLVGSSGRGLLLMWAFMDKVSYDKTGNVVSMLKSREQHPGRSQAEAKSAGRRKPRPRVMGMLSPVDGGKQVELVRERITIGRDASCDLVVHSGAVSHHHCVLYLHLGWWFVRDLRSKNGVKINHKVVQQHLVPPGCTLSIGPHDYRVDYSPHDLGYPGITPPADPF